MRVAVLSSSGDGGKSWSPPKQVNTTIEPVQGDENGPKVAFNADKKAFVVWSIPGEKGDITRANIRFAMEDGKGGFTPARTLNEIKDTARFPIIEFTPDNTLLVAWIDRRIDNPIPRSLYLMRISSTGQELTKSYKVGEGLCECCRLGITFADGGKTVYMVDRQVGQESDSQPRAAKINGRRQHIRRARGNRRRWLAGAFLPAFRPHHRPGQPWLSPRDLVYARSLGQVKPVFITPSRKDGGRSFAPRQLIHANTAAEILHTTMTAANDGTVYFAWDNLDE